MYRGRHRVNVEKVVEQAQSQSAGIVGKASSVNLGKMQKRKEKEENDVKQPS